MSEPGYAVSSLDDIGHGYGFRKIRRELGVTAFGINALVLPPGYETGVHYHDEQEETYFVHSGRIEFRFGDGQSFLLEPGRDGEGRSGDPSGHEERRGLRRGRRGRRRQGRLRGPRRAGDRGAIQVPPARLAPATRLDHAGPAAARPAGQRARLRSRRVAGLGHRRCVVFDRPGWDGVRAPTDLEGNASAALAELDVHGISRAVVVGHSFGGAVAAWLAARFADRVAGVVLLAPSANIASLYPFDRLLAAPVVGPLLSGALVGGCWVGSERRAGCGARSPATRPTWPPRARRMRSPSAWRAFAVEQRVLFADLPELESSLGRIAAPTRVLAGGADWLVPISSLRTLAEDDSRREARGDQAAPAISCRGVGPGL